MKYDPWHDSHAPRNFERTDRSGRYSPIVDPEKDWSYLYLYGAIALLVAVLMIGMFL